MILIWIKSSETIKPEFRHDASANTDLYTVYVIFLYWFFNLASACAINVCLTSPQSYPLKIVHILLVYLCFEIFILGWIFYLLGPAQPFNKTVCNPLAGPFGNFSFISLAVEPLADLYLLTCLHYSTGPWIWMALV